MACKPLQRLLVNYIYVIVVTRSTWAILVSLVDEQQGTSKSMSSESFGTFDEVIQVDPSYKPSSDKTDGMPLSWANGNWISLKLFKFVFHILCIFVQEVNSCS